MAAALSLTCGRGGALIGNILFGFLVDLNCFIPVVLFAALLLGKLALGAARSSTFRSSL